MVNGKGRLGLHETCCGPKAPCVEIIRRATSIIDYDQRASTSAPVCPVLRELYGAPEKHAVPWFAPMPLLF